MTLTLKIAFLSIIFGVVTTISFGQESVRWGATFKETYRDLATGNDISFSVKTPPRPASPTEKLPLIVALKAGPKVPPSAELPFFEVRPSGGGIWGYRAMSTVDVMSVIAVMKEKYPIDSDRVSLVGFSAGASGAMHLASLYPDKFSAVVAMVAAGNDYPIRNFLNLPVAIHHGDLDWTSAICDARVQFRKMQAAGNQLAILKEYPGVGHSVPAKEHETIVKWMLEQKRDVAPKSVFIDCETPALGKHAYIQILEFDDPHKRATLDAKREFGGLKIESTNVTALTLNLGKFPDLERIYIGDQELQLSPDRGLAELRKSGNAWQLRSGFRPTASEIRSYSAGAAANLYEGEPLLIVYGTGDGDPNKTARLRVVAEDLAKCGGPIFATMKHAEFPIVADSELTPEQEESCNLILIGRPVENSIAARIVEKWPIRIREGKLEAGNREPLALEEQVLSMLHFNPDHPERLVYLIAPFTNVTPRLPKRFLAGSDGFHRIGQPDLIVQDVENKIAREMQFDKEWKWISHEDDSKKIQAGLDDRDQLAVAHLHVMRTQSGADFAMWWGPQNKLQWGVDFNFLKEYQSEHYSLADFKTQKRVIETMIGGVSGADLKLISDLWISKNEITVFPEIDLDSIEPEKNYRIHIPMDLYIKLGQRKKNLMDPKSGPEISPYDLISEIFK